MSVVHRFVERDRRKAVRKGQIRAFPYMTEKTAGMRARNTFAMLVGKEINKLDVKESFKKEYGIQVEVNTLVRKGKLKKVRGVPGKRKDKKIAIIRFPKDFQLPGSEV